MSTDEPIWQRIRYDQPVERVARITLARAEAANAQDYLMLSELNEAFDRAARDPDVRVPMKVESALTFTPAAIISEA